MARVKPKKEYASFQMKVDFPKLADSHAHIREVNQVGHFLSLADTINASRVGVACQTDLSSLNDNPAGFALKALYPERFYIMAGLDHSQRLYGIPDTPSLSDQARFLHEMGVDGIKVLAGKPDSRKKLGVPLDGPYFREFFSACEELDLPILWHVADPEEFWDPSKLPQWAREQGWGYDESFPSKEDLYRETENVLARHSSLRVILAHFYFLSADLERAEGFLEKFPNVKLDLAPGIELYYNLSADLERARHFFCRYPERILFGTDIMGHLSKEQASARAGIVYRFLAGVETFRVPGEADSLLGDPGDGIIRTLSLSKEALDRILWDCFVTQYGPSPKRLNRAAAEKECKRLAGLQAQLKSRPGEETEGGKALEYLRK